MSLVHTQELAYKEVEYMGRVRELVEEMLKKKLGGLAELRDVFITLREHDNNKYEEIIEVSLDVTGLLGINKECLWFEGVEYQCANYLGNEPVCDEESGKFNEKKCEKMFDECVREEIRQFKEDNCGLPFHWGYSNPPTSIAYLRSYEDEDAYKLCCGVELYYRYTVYPFRDAMAEILSSPERLEKMARYTAETVVAEVMRLVEALRALAP